ncbi:putative 11-S seed storage protein, plant [Helianthus anomalus]
MEQQCGSMKVKVNIENPSQADFLNVERGELRPNAIQSPHWTINVHNLLYVTKGDLRVQIVDNQGNLVFDNELREGQVVVIPQNFAVIKRTNEQGSRWVSFKTNDNAMIVNLAGRVSAISSMPVDLAGRLHQVFPEAKGGLQLKSSVCVESC